ncbi:MAG: sugar phosphate isomerase/epimerase [Planctomycetes bacterium]|nr:sugar phosphate isomerase/epimerase [Planctomycetota bacterium]
MPITTLPLGVTAVMLPDLDFDEQIALLKRCGVTHYSIRPRIIPEGERGKAWGNWGNHKFDLTPARLVKEGKEIRKKLLDAGLTPFGTVPAVTLSDSDDVLKEAFEGAAITGAGRVRVSPLNWTGYPHNQVINYAETVKKNVEGYQRVVTLARGYKQKVVIETHCGSIAASPALALNICRNFKPEDLGTIFDIANFNIEGAYNPNLAVAVLDQYIDHVHIGGSRRVQGLYDSAGCRQSATVQVPIGEADLYIPAWLKALHDAGRHVPLMIEDFTQNVSGALRLETSAAALHRALASL